MRNVRNKLLIIVLLCTLSFHVSNAYASESKTIINGNQETNNLLLWNEEFNEEKINNNYWKVFGPEEFMNEYGYGSTLPFWMYDPVLCKVKDGCLSMKTQMFWNNRQNCVRKGNQSVTSSKIISKNLIECKYGRIDIRAK